jgi:hypothetical protein
VAPATIDEFFRNDRRFIVFMMVPFGMSEDRPDFQSIPDAHKPIGYLRNDQE